MNNYIEYKDEIAFHPGYYIKEIIEDSQLTQEDFAKKLGTTPKNLSLLIRGEQKLSVDMAVKLSRMLGTSIEYWLNTQKTFDVLIAKFKSDKELEEERNIFKSLDYNYFIENFNLPKLSRQIDKQIEQVRKLLNIATLSVLSKPDLSVNFRSANSTIQPNNIIRANAMVQLALYRASKINAPAFNRKLFEKAIQYALTLTKRHKDFFPLLKNAFLKAGVILIVLPNISGSKINGATKRIGRSIMLMVNDRRLFSDIFWFTLFHEIGHIMNNDYGISFDKDTGEKEKAANQYAADHLIPPMQYQKFLSQNDFSVQAIQNFAEKIDRDPSIIVGRLQNDKLVSYNDHELDKFQHRYKIKIVLKA